MEALHLMNSTSAEIGCSGYNNKSTGVQNWQWTAYGAFLKLCYPQIIHSKGFSILNHPAVGYPHLKNPPDWRWWFVSVCFRVNIAWLQAWWSPPLRWIWCVPMRQLVLVTKAGSWCSGSQLSKMQMVSRWSQSPLWGWLVSKNMCWTPFRGLNKYDKDDLMRMHRRIQNDPNN